MHITTDGESYGHHHPFGDMALAYVLNKLRHDPEVRLTNYGEFLELHPPEWEVEIHENSSWSCFHGVERWRSDCGCHMRGDWQQRWRGPLRLGLDTLKERLSDKASDEQRVDNCRVPLDKRGSKTRPDCDRPSSASEARK